MYTTASQPLHWIFYAPGMPFHGGSILNGDALGGSESACFYLAKEAASCGYQVSVFSHIPPQQAGRWDGVDYFSAGKHPLATDLPGEDCINAVRSIPHDVLISQRLMRAFAFPNASRCNFWWAHDMPAAHLQPKMQAQEWNIDAILAVSNFHKHAIATTYQWPQQQIAVIPNAVDESLFSSPAPEQCQPLQKRLQNSLQKRLFYSSRPERGLEYLVGSPNGKAGIMEYLLKSNPEITLFVCAYHNSPPAIKELHRFLKHRCEILPNVRWLGALSKAELARQMMQAWLHVYPTRFPEVSCITAMETQAAGLPILCTTSGALTETLSGGGAILVPLTTNDDKLRMRFVKEIIALAKNDARWLELHQKTKSGRNRPSWSNSFQQLEALVSKKLQPDNYPERLAMSMLREPVPPIDLLQQHLAKYPQRRSKLMNLARKRCASLLAKSTPTKPDLEKTPSPVILQSSQHSQRSQLESPCHHIELARNAVLTATKITPSLPAGTWLKPLRQTFPRQTLSACILTRVQEAGLASCLASIAGIVDELIVGLDKNSPHSHAEGQACKALIHRYGGRILNLPSPLNTGFSVARNCLLRNASADWVLWLDTDEVLVGEKNLDKYLRANIFHTYAVPQYHFSLQPVGLLKTDLPCRLFRRRSSFRFRGIVHEHPEQCRVPNKFARVFVLPDVAISHQGYLTEETRRRRFLRNLPLMKLDRATNPKRPLGCFLWIRDLTQLNRFEQEQSGQLGVKASQRAKEAVGLWRHLVKKKYTQLALDALPYYSECARLLRGTEAVSLSLPAPPPILTDHITSWNSTQTPPSSIEGVFMDTTDAEKFAGLLLKKSLLTCRASNTS